MPRHGSSDIPHTASTDHRILRGGKAAPAREAGPIPDDGFPVVSFYRQRKVACDEDERDRAVALVNLALVGDAAAARALWKALPALEQAVRRDPGDLPAGEAHGHALGLQDHRAEALAAFQAVLARDSDREVALVGAAAMAEELGQTETALGYWRRAVRTNPWSPDYRRRLVLLGAKQKTWDKVGPECQAWVRLDPFSVEARAVLVNCWLAASNKDEARAEYKRIEALAPSNLTELEIRFRKKLR
jgi:tetratricopeptide (TPR) repeat protein